MSACPTFLATSVALVASLIYRIVAFLALRIRASGVGTTHSTTVQIRAQIATSATCVLAWAGNVARLATWRVRHAPPLPIRARQQRCACGASTATATLPRKTRLDGGVRAGRLVPRVRGVDDARQAGDANRSKPRERA